MVRWLNMIVTGSGAAAAGPGGSPDTRSGWRSRKRCSATVARAVERELLRIRLLSPPSVSDASSSQDASPVSS
jgi:hypothetical protein